MDSMSEELVLANTDVAVLRATCSSTTVLSLDYDEPPPAELRWRYEREESVVRAMAMLCELTDIPWLDFLSQSAPPTQVDEFDSGRCASGGCAGRWRIDLASAWLRCPELPLAPPSGPPPPSCPPSPAHSEPDAGAGFDPAGEAAAAAAAANAAITAAGLVAATAAHVSEGLFASLWTSSGFRGVYRNEHTRNPSKPWEAFLPMQRTAPAGSINNPNAARPEVVYTQRSLGFFADPIQAARALRAEADALEGQPSGEGGERPVKLLPNPTGAYIAECRERGGEINVVQILKQADQEDLEDGRREKLESHISERSESGLKGVHKTGTGRWQVQVYFGGGLYHVGAHDTTPPCARTYSACMALVSGLKARGLIAADDATPKGGRGRRDSIEHAQQQQELDQLELEGDDAKLQIFRNGMAETGC